MIKVATLSYQNAYNYGAVFQVSALQYVISQLGTDCDIIDYRCPAIDFQYNFRPIQLNKTLFKDIRANLVLCPFIKEKKKNFQHWLNSYKKTKIFKNKNELIELNEHYDKFVVGSDQVWNLKCQGYDKSFFLDFVNDNTKKIAYSASFGTYNLKPEDLLFFKEYIQTFDSISVRENRGIELVKELTGKQSVACMDPVLLAGKAFWDSKKNQDIATSERYIFVYQLSHNKSIPKFVKQLKKETALKIYFVTVHIGNIVHYSIKDKNVSAISPEYFLSLISNAEYVITDSFHATVLSLLFQRQFFVVSEGDEKTSYNTRIFNLLSEYNLKKRIQKEYHHMDAITDDEYQLIAQKIDQLRKKSLLFLQRSLGL